MTKLKGNIITNCLFLVLPFLLQSCWTFENDITEIKTLTGNFKIILCRNDKEAGYVLSRNYSDGAYQVMEKRCEAIYFDSTKIFVAYTWHNTDTTTPHYSIIRILESEKVPYQEQELSSKDFYEQVKSCKDCTSWSSSSANTRP